MSTLDVVDRWDRGFSWTLAEEADRMHRTSHAIRTKEGVWIVDPVDASGLDNELAELGEVAGVTLLLDRHKRDTAAVAARHGVPVSLPESLAGVADELDTTTKIYSRALPGTKFQTVSVINNRLWSEVALHNAERGTLIVPESVGTVDMFTTGEERLGVHPALRLLPPRKSLGEHSPDSVLVGHGSGVFDDAANALRVALARSRKSAPGYYAGLLGSLVR